MRHFGILFAIAALLTPWRMAVAADAELALRRDTEAALAAMRPAIDQASARWRAEFVGKIKARNGQPLPETAVLAEVRRATQAVADVAPQIESLWREFQQQRIDARGFGDQLDGLFEQAVVTSWDMHLTEARRALAIAQNNLDESSGELRRQWTQTVAGISRREGLTSGQRQQLIAAASAPVQAAERALLNTAGQQLDAIARRLARARQTLQDLVVTRAEAARAAGRPGAPQRLSGLIATQFESTSGSASDAGSSLDAFLASAQLATPTIVLRGQPQHLTLAERIEPLLATRLTAENENRLQGPRPKPPPRIASVMVLERGVDPATGDATRLLGVLGIGLIDRGAPSVYGEPDRAYEVVATRAGVLGVRPDESNAAAWTSLAQRATEGLLPSDATMAKLLDAVLVRVRLPAGLLPGLESITVAGAGSIWPLDAPTTRGTLAFVRVMPWGLRDEVDRPQELFLGSEFAVQVETDHPIRSNRLEIALIGPEGRLTFEDAAGAKVQALPATRTSQSAKIVRTPPVFLVPAGLGVPPQKRTPGTYYVEARHQDTLLAAIVGRPFDDGGAATTVDAATVLASPGNIPTVDGKGMLFLEAVVDAARIHHIDLPAAQLSSDQVVDMITHTFIAQLRQHEIKFTLADHAAMLALKRAFIAMAGRVLASHRAVLASPTRIGAYVPEMTRIMMRGARLASDTGHTGNFPLGYAHKIRIVSEKGLTAFARREFGFGGDVPLYYAFVDSGPSTVYDDPEQAAIFRLAATRRALETQSADLEKAIAYARNCDDDDVKELLGLVGSGFASVIAEVMPRLVRAEHDPATSRSRWVPDRAARQAITQLRTTLEEHLTAARGAKADTEAVLALLTATGMGLGGSVASKVVLAVASAASVGVAGLDIAHLELSRAESKFAAAAVEIIGEDRLVLDVGTIDLRPTPYLTFALSVIGLKFDASDMAKAIDLSSARRAGTHSLAEIAEHGFAKLARLPHREQAMVSALMDEATSLRAAGKPLTPAQQGALRAADRIESQFAAHHPWGGGPFDPKPALHPPPDDLRSAVTEPGIDFRSGVTEAEPRTSPSVTSEPSAPRPAVVPSAAAPSAASAARMVRYMDVKKIPPGMPMPGDPLLGAMYRVGQPYGAGGYATTYELLDATGRPTGRVVKFLRQPFEDEATLVARLNDGDRAGSFTTPAPWDETPLPELVDRLMEGQRLLENAKIPHLKMAPLEEGIGAAGRNGFPPFVVQDLIPEDAVLAASSRLETGQQEAVARLYKQLADANLVWLDGHYGNLYFKRTPDGWEAGILDPDMLFDFNKEIANAFIQRRVGQIFALPHRYGIKSLEGRPELMVDAFSPDIAQRVCQSSHEFMARMLEHKGWVKYQTVEKAAVAATQFKFAGAIDPEIVSRIFGSLAKYVRPH